MPRTARKKTETGIYHIMLRGTDRRLLFTDDEDCDRFIDTLKRVKEISKFQLYAYCLMGNHVHLVLREGDEPLELVFKRLGASYAYYYNWKYQLQGHLFQDRFRSEPINDDAYFMDVLRYICQNPVKACLSETMTDYPWLRCSGVNKTEELDDISVLTDLTREELLAFVSEPCSGEHLEENLMRRLSDREAAELICSACGCRHVLEIGGLEKTRRDKLIKKSSELGISIRQLSRLAGISKAIIERVLKE